MRRVARRWRIVRKKHWNRPERSTKSPSWRRMRHLGIFGSGALEVGAFGVAAFGIFACGIFGPLAFLILRSVELANCGFSLPLAIRYAMTFGFMRRLYNVGVLRRRFAALTSTFTPGGKGGAGRFAVSAICARERIGVPL